MPTSKIITSFLDVPIQTWRPKMQLADHLNLHSVLSASSKARCVLCAIELSGHTVCLYLSRWESIKENGPNSIKLSKIAISHSFSMKIQVTILIIKITWLSINPKRCISHFVLKEVSEVRHFCSVMSESWREKPLLDFGFIVIYQFGLLGFHAVFHMSQMPHFECIFFSQCWGN